MQMQLIAWHHRPLEARAVDADKIVDRLVIGFAAERPEREDGRRLRQGFENQHPRHHRVVGKVAVEKRLVHTDVFERMNMLARLDIDHPVYQQHGVAVWQMVEDGVNVHRCHAGVSGASGLVWCDLKRRVGVTQNSLMKF